MTRSQWEVAHLAFDAARIATAMTRGYALLQKLIQHAVMKLFAQLRGE